MGAEASRPLEELAARSYHRPMALPTGDRLVLLHNPRCSKSRAALALLEERKAAFETRLYLEEPLSRDELVDLSSRVGKPVAAFARKKEAGEHGVDLAGDEQALIDAIATQPAILERPILVSADKAVVGRPPEDILALL